VPGRGKEERASDRWARWAAGAGWLTLAATILAWPRRESLSHRFWRGVGETCRRLRRSPQIAAPADGRGATSPFRIPLAGWRAILARTFSAFNADRIPNVAAGVAFFALLSLFPALAAFVSLYGLFADVHGAERELSLLAGVLPRESLAFAADQMRRFAAKDAGQLTFALGLSVLVSIWSANGAVKAMFQGLNVAYEMQERRNLLVLNLWSLAFTVGGLLFLMLALTAVVATPQLFAALGYSEGAAMLDWLRWPAVLAGAVVAVSLLYRYGPCRRPARWRWVTWGGAGAAALWLVASMLFSWYVGAFAHYDRTYGPLGAVVAFMTWIWLSTTIVLAGAELNAAIEAQMGGDTSVDARP